MDIRKLVYETLINDATLCALLAEGAKSVYTTYSEDAGTYPVVVVSLVDDVPELHADNKEIASLIRFQVTIITEDAEYNAIESLVKKDMLDLGAMRALTTEYRDNQHFRVLQFRIPNLV
ncbi:MAG: hypothetical protein J6O04_01435 [Selenomonadaceae bacterium]|nr:hypothetical protein [Selenomonadaceae bacterium]